MGHRVGFVAPELSLAFDVDVALDFVWRGNQNAARLDIVGAEKRPEQQRIAIGVGRHAIVNRMWVQCEGSGFDAPEAVVAKVPAGLQTAAGKGAVVDVMGAKKDD